VCVCLFIMYFVKQKFEQMRVVQFVKKFLDSFKK